MKPEHFFFILLPLLSLSLGAQTPSHPIQSLKSVRKGNSAYHKGDLKTAQAQYRKALEQHEQSLKANYNLGNVYYRDKDFKKALAQYQSSAKLSRTKSQKARAFYNMGEALMRQKQYAPAVKAYLQALRNAPKDNEIRYNYALAKSLLKKQKQQHNKKGDNKNKNKNKDNKNKKGGSDKNKDKKNNKDKKDKKGSDKDKGGKNKKPKGDQKDKSKGQEPRDSTRKKQSGPLSEQQIDRLLEALQNAENKTQKKVRAKEEKRAVIKTQKDW